MVELSEKYLIQAFTGKIKPCEDMVKFYYHLKMHADGGYPEALIEERRPSEALTIKDYRKKIFVPITECAFSKIITSLGKIRKSPDYNVTYNEAGVPASIKDTETPKKYFNENYPVYKSLTNWMFSVLLKNYLIDSNAVVLVMPNNLGSEEHVYLKPVPTIFNSDKIIDYVADSYAVLISDEKCSYTSSGKTYSDGQVVFVVTDTYIQKWNQSGPKFAMTMEYEYLHELGFMPVFKLKGNYFSNEYNKVIYKPKIYPIVHRLNEAVREYSDLQAEVVQHIHSEKWVYATQQCNTCQGTGKMKDGKLSNCTNPNCNGGKVVNNPYETLVVTPQSLLDGGASVPTPPAGYIQKQVDIVTIQDKRVQDHIYFALSAINMEFLSETPLSQSGDAKEVDRDELNNFVHSIAEDIISIGDEVSLTSMRYRYGKLITDENVLVSITPIISVPERFDLLNTSYLLAEIKSAKDSGLNAFTLNSLQIDYVNKKFTHDKEIAKKLESIIMLDPLSGYTQDEKITILQNKGISELDYVVSSNIELFVDTAIHDNDKFLYLPVKEKLAIIKKLGQTKMKEISPVSNLMSAVDIANGVTGNALKDSVGGLTGMIEIAKAVASGLYDLEAAIALVSDRFGITEEEARRQLGTPTITGPAAVEKVATLV